MCVSQNSECLVKCISKAKLYVKIYEKAIEAFNKLSKAYEDQVQTQAQVFL